MRYGIDRGYMDWNNSGGNYEDISPDPEDTVLSPWHHNEAAKQTRIPAFSKEENAGDSEVGLANENSFSTDEILSVWNTVMEQEDYETQVKSSRNFLRVEPFPAVNHE